MSVPAGDNPTVTRLLDAAGHLFYDEGVGVGVARLCEVAGVSKRSMYQFFDSKDDVLAACLARGVPGYLAGLLPEAAESLGPRARIVYVAARIEETASDPGFRGCPYVSVAAEVKSGEHPARVVARRFHDTLTTFFRDALVEGGVTSADQVARQLTAVHDGVLAGSVVQGRPLHGVATSMVAALLDAAGLMDEM